jgi:DNA-binding transcriptional LysR family regulator
MRIFVAVAEEEGFAPAARRLSLSPPAVTRAVSALEERLDARLLHRTTRAVRLTDAGIRFLADCKRILGELDDAEAAAAGAHAEPRGPLALTAPVLFGRLHVTPIVLEFAARHPLVVPRLVLVDRIVDLVDEGLDAAVRIGHLPDSSLSATKVGWVRQVVVGSPAYLDTRGAPTEPSELAHHDVIGFGGAFSPVDWTFVPGSSADGARSSTVSLRPRLIVNLADVAVDAALAGRGITRVLSYQVIDHVRAGRLRILLEPFEPPPLPVHVVHAGGRRASARVRLFVDLAVERLRAILPGGEADGEDAPGGGTRPGG